MIFIQHVLLNSNSGTFRATTKNYFTTASKTINFKKNKGNLPTTRSRTKPIVPISTRTTGKTATTKNYFSTTCDTSKYFKDKAVKKTTERAQKPVRIPATTRTRGKIEILIFSLPLKINENMDVSGL